MFAESDVLRLTVEASLEPAFAAAAAGEPAGPLPGIPQRTKEPFAGTLSYVARDGATVVLDAELKVRGNSSLEECSFPKLSAKIKKGAARSASIFHDASRIKIGTHCDEATSAGGRIGRLRNQLSTHREALAYTLARRIEAPGAPMLRTRPAHITWIDTSTGERLERDAFILEHPKAAAKRLGLPDHCRDIGGEEECDPVLDDPELATTDPAAFDRDAVTRILMLHALLGNWDFAVDPESARSHSGRIWNTDVLVLAPNAEGARPLAPVPQDFDLASFVNGEVRTREVPADLLAGRPAAARQAAHYLREYLAGRSAAEIARARLVFEDARVDMLEAVRLAPIDDEGRGIARAHVDGFFEALASLQ